MEARRATSEMVAAANPPAGYQPIVSNSNFAWENGPIFEKHEDGKVWRGFRVAERHINAGGMCHGGMMMTFADIMLATAVMQVAKPPFVTVRLTTDFINAVKLGEWVEATAICDGVQDGMVSVSAVIQVSNRPVSNASGLFKLLRRGSKRAMPKLHLGGEP